MHQPTIKHLWSLPKPASSGFTIIELMITIAILAVIAGFAIPSFQTIIENNQTATQANNLLSAVQLARSEAVKRGVDVSLSADTNDFNNGWCVHTGAACDNTNRIRTFEANNALSLSSAVTEVTFSARGGRTPPTGGDTTISVQPGTCATGEDDRRSIVTVQLTGRAAVAKGNCL